MTRIPVTMCHGIRKDPVTVLPADRDHGLSIEHFGKLMTIARDLGFESIDYDRLERWRSHGDPLPEKPILIDFDHPVKSIASAILPVLAKLEYTGNLFVHTAPIEALGTGKLRPEVEAGIMNWEDLDRLLDAGWGIGAHTHSHPDLSELSLADPGGGKISEELDSCDRVLFSNLGLRPRDFAFCGVTWSTSAERAVKERYRFGRLWIVCDHYFADGKRIRFAELAGSSEPDEEDGGPPFSTRYITEETDPYRLPSMDLQSLIWEPDAFRAYLEGAVP